MRRLLPIAAALLLVPLLPGRARADDYTIAYDTVQATAYRGLSNGFLGSRVTIGQVELNTPETNQVAFSGIRFTFHQADSGGNHPTAVGSILYGRATNFSGGVATGVTNVEYWNANNFINSVIGPNAAITPKVINQSFSLATTNDVIDAYYNSYIQQRKVIIVSGGNNNSAVLDSPGSMANGITVWTSDSAGNPTGGGLGPTVDMRAKPDLIAPRSAQVAASPSIAGNNNTFTNSSYASIEGPSLSAPFVAGAAAILVDKAMGTPSLSNATDPRVVKSLLMTSAKKMAGWHRGTNGTADDATTPLDYTQGAGLLQVKSAYDLLVAGEQAYGTGNVLSNGWDYANVGGGNGVNQASTNRTRTYNLFLSNGVFLNTNFSITATLNWLVDVSNPSLGLAGETTENLDLRLKYNGAYVQYSTSLVDNVEHIWFSTNAPGIYTLEVTHLSSLATDFALSWSAVPIPEPTSALLLGAAFATCLFARRAARAR